MVILAFIGLSYGPSIGKAAKEENKKKSLLRLENAKLF